MGMRVEISTASFMILDCDQGPICHIPWHAGIVQRVANESRLKSGAIKSIAIPTAIEDFQMDVEEKRVKDNRPNDERDGATGNLLECFHYGLPQISQDEPQFAGRMQTHQEHHKQTHKLNADRAGKHGTGE